MKLKTYHAYSMAEALAAVKQDLGAEAVILHTRTFKRGGILGLRRTTIFEVTATPAPPSKSARSVETPRRKNLQTVQAQRAYTTVGSAAPPAAPVDDRERTRKLAMAMEETHRRRVAANSPPPPLPLPPETPSQRMASSSTAMAPATPVERTARRFILSSADLPVMAPRADRIETKPPRPDEPIARAPALNPMMADELSAIKQMVGQVLQRQSAPSGDSSGAPSLMPCQLFDQYLRLIAQDLSVELAQQIINEVRDELSQSDLDDEAMVRNAVMNHLAGFIPVNESVFPSRSEDGRPFTLALVGPTGVGKTTTLAKLAATFKLHHGRSVGLVTADTYRIAAVDQLRTYADIIDVPLQVALTPAEMKRAIQSFHDRDVILIDTAGRSQRDSSRLSELKRFIAAANPHEVHLVLSGTASEKVLLQEAQAFSQVGVHKIVLTKLDEAVSFGMLINVIRQIGKQLSFITTGQEVPDHLEVGRGERLAELVVGGKLETEPAAR